MQKRQGNVTSSCFGKKLVELSLAQLFWPGNGVAGSWHLQLLGFDEKTQLGAGKKPGACSGGGGRAAKKTMLECGHVTP